jgi:hypothetical protein
VADRRRHRHFQRWSHTTHPLLKGFVVFGLRSHRRAVVAGTVLALLAALVVGCGSDDTADNAPASSDPSANRSTSAPASPLPDSWITPRFSDPVLESDAANVPFTQVPDNPKGELLPPNTRLDGPVMWQAVGCQALAFSSDAGPTRRSPDGWPQGWTRTPKGAALAAWSIAILFEVMPDRDEFADTYLTGADTAGFVQRSEVRDPRAGVRQSNWKDSGRCFRSSATRRVDLDVSVQLSNNDRYAAVRWYSPKYDVTWDFPVVWDDQHGDWKATPEGFRQYWQTVDEPTSRPITAEFSW